MSPVRRRARIGRKEAGRLTDHLDNNRFFDRNAGSTYMLFKKPKPPYYTLTVYIGRDNGYFEYLKPGPDTLARLEALVNEIRSADARNAMHLLTNSPAAAPVPAAAR
jgi:hypothetical protein